MTPREWICWNSGKGSAWALHVVRADGRFDRELLAALPAGADPCAENGEFHTYAVAGPMFDRHIAVEVGQTVDRDGFVFTDLTMAGQSC